MSFRKAIINGVACTLVKSGSQPGVYAAILTRKSPYAFMKWRPCSSLPIVNDPILQGVKP